MSAGWSMLAELLIRVFLECRYVQQPCQANSYISNSDNWSFPEAVKQCKLGPATWLKILETNEVSLHHSGLGGAVPFMDDILSALQARALPVSCR